MVGRVAKALFDWAAAGAWKDEKKPTKAERIPATLTQNTSIQNIIKKQNKFAG
jgi:endonuclease III-like uncharacterized protein